ncbi:MAG: TlpA disulfide reductase family protein [Planctomycetota bacterium]|nr:TlpA disulfide reductase family protein [Planctomycetota bacterium]MDI6788788.1 TlpA disulfide reductase family protein [Planctomycetota bacterium]
MIRFLIALIISGFILFTSCDVQPSSTTSQPATKAPDFTLKDLSGNEVKLSDIIGSKPLVLNFWASWCPSCVEKMPKLINLYNQSSDKFTLVGINLDRSLESAQSYTRKNNINPAKAGWERNGIVGPLYLNLYDEGGKVARLYGVYGIPALIIINQTGEIIKRNASLDDIKNLIK